MTAFYIIITHLSPRITSQIRTIPCFAPSHLPPLLKVRCCRPKKFGRLPEGLPHHHPSLAPTLPKPHYPPRFPYCNCLYALICFHIRTILFAFRRGVGLPLPFHRILSPSQPLQKNTNHLPFLPFPLHRTSPFLQPSQKHIHRFASHHHTCLPSLSSQVQHIFIFFDKLNGRKVTKAFARSVIYQGNNRIQLFL